MRKNFTATVLFFVFAHSYSFAMELSDQSVPGSHALVVKTIYEKRNGELVEGGKSCDVFETSRLTNVFPLLKQDTLLLLDLDGVIMSPVCMLGSDKWAYHEGDKYIAAMHRGSFAGGLKAFNAAWNFVQEHVDVRAVDPEFSPFLQRLEDEGRSVIGFTARGIPLIERTKVQLGSIGVDFNRFKYYQGQLGGDKYRYEGNILYVQIGSNKGEQLGLFSGETGKEHSHVLVVDDREKNLITIKTRCEENGIECDAVLYTGDAPAVAAFDKQTSDVQFFWLRAFGSVLSDDQARMLLDFFHGRVEQEGSCSQGEESDEICEVMTFCSRDLGLGSFDQCGAPDLIKFFGKLLMDGGYFEPM